MIKAFVAPDGIDLAIGAQLRLAAREEPRSLHYVFSRRPAGAEHIVRGCENAFVGFFGDGGTYALLRSLRRRDSGFELTVIGDPVVGSKLFSDPELSQAVRVYHPTGCSASALRLELSSINMTNVDILKVQNHFALDVTRELLEPLDFAKVKLDLSWTQGAEPAAFQLNLASLGTGVPLIWCGALDRVGSGYREFARLFAHVPPSMAPLLVLTKEAKPVEFDDLCANLGMAGAFGRTSVLTAPSLSFLSALVAAVRQAGGAGVVTALEPFPNPLLAYAFAEDLPIFGFSGSSLNDLPGRPQAVADPGDTQGLARLLTDAIRP